MSAANEADRAEPISSVPMSGISSVAFEGKLAPQVHQRLVKALGQKRATDVLHEALARLGGRPIETPQDMLDLAVVLVRYGGLVEAVARSLKVQALLRGAVER